MNENHTHTNPTALEHSITSALAHRATGTTITRSEWDETAEVNAVISITAGRAPRTKQIIAAVTAVAAVAAGVVVWKSLDNTSRRTVQVANGTSALTADVFELQTGGPLQITEVQADAEPITKPMDRTVSLLCQSEIASDGSCRAPFPFNISRSYTARSGSGAEFVVQLQTITSTPISVLEKAVDALAQRRGATATPVPLDALPSSTAGFAARLSPLKMVIVGLARTDERGSAVLSIDPTGAGDSSEPTSALISELMGTVVVSSEDARVVGEQIELVGQLDGPFGGVPLYRPVGSRDCMTIEAPGTEDPATNSTSSEADGSNCPIVTFALGQIFVPGRTGATARFTSPYLAVGPDVARLEVVTDSKTSTTPLSGDLDRFGYSVPIEVINSLVTESTQGSEADAPGMLRALVAYDADGNEIDRVEIDHTPQLDPAYREIASGQDWAFGYRKNNETAVTDCEFAGPEGSVDAPCGGMFVGHQRVAVMSPPETDHLLVGGQRVPIAAKQDQLLALAVIDAPMSPTDISAIAADGTVLRRWTGVIRAAESGMFSTTPDSSGDPLNPNPGK